MNTMEGAFSLASEKSWLTSFSDSPSHLETRSEEDTLKKVDSASVATALARYDFPVPGGPYRRMPLHGFLFPADGIAQVQYKRLNCNRTRKTQHEKVTHTVRARTASLQHIST